MKPLIEGEEPALAAMRRNIAILYFGEANHGVCCYWGIP